MRIAFRVDASTLIGTGHVMRCLTLADALRERGCNCVFIHREHDGNLAQLIEERGYSVERLPRPSTAHADAAQTPYASWLGLSESTDASQSCDVLARLRPDWLVVDHYALGARWQEQTRQYVERIAVIDDLANRSHDCDLLMDQNDAPQCETRYERLVPSSARILCGPQYAMLAPRFPEARQSTGPRRGPLSRIMVFYGGSDIQNETGRALRVLSEPEFIHLEIDVVIGVNNPHRDSLMALALERPHTKVYGSRPHLLDLMIAADLALGAGGATTWERCVTGLPAIVTAIAENQVFFNEVLAAKNAIVYLGYWENVSDNDLHNALSLLTNSDSRLAEIAENAWHITDGLGPLRVSESIRPTAINELALRRAHSGDVLLYFNWANDPTTRRHAHSSEPIPWATHIAWFEKHLGDPQSKLWVLQTPEGLPVGQFRTQCEGKLAVLSYSLDRTFRGRGWGSALLRLGVQAWQQSRDSECLVGEVLNTNNASYRAFISAGFTQTPATSETMKKFVYYPPVDSLTIT